MQAPALLVREAALTKEEANDLSICGYPLAKSNAALEHDEARDEAALDSREEKETGQGGYLPLS